MTSNTTDSSDFYQQQSLPDILEAAGIPDNDFYMGLVLSTESAGLDDARMEKAFQDWTDYYSDSTQTNFGWVLCHLICKADRDNLHRISKGYPEHVRVFAEKNILANVDPEKVEQVMANEQQ